jgi:hypothetical protein
MQKNQNDLIYDFLIEAYLDDEPLDENNEEDLRYLNKILIKKWGSDFPGDGCIFITPEGKYLNIWPTLRDHEFLGAWIAEQGYGLNIEEPMWFVHKLGYIRCRSTSTLCYIDLPEKTKSSQLGALQYWLEQKVENNCARIDIGVPSGDCKTYKLKEYFAEDLIDIIKRFYSSGILYENFK